MPPDLNTLWTLVDQLDAEAECVTFYDALALVRAAKSFEDIPKGLIVDWVALHDAPHVTDGARLILGQYLQRLGHRQQQDRNLAKQLILLKDSGKTLRVPIGQPIAIALEVRFEQGLVWHLSDGPEFLRYDAMPLGTTPGDSRLKARWVLSAMRAGSGTCHFEEVRDSAAEAPAAMPHKASKRTQQTASARPHTFEIFIIAEDV